MSKRYSIKIQKIKCHYTSVRIPITIINRLIIPTDRLIIATHAAGKTKIGITALENGLVISSET